MDTSRKIKIVATIGPASEGPEILSRLVSEGMDAARLNFSHDIHERHRARINIIRRLEKKLSKPIAIIADIQGPKMRVGDLPEGGVYLKEGGEVLIDTSTSVYRNGVIPLPSPVFKKGVSRGSSVFLDDGTIMLEVSAVRGDKVMAKVKRGGTLKPRKGVNVPALKIRSGIFSTKDIADIKFAKKVGADYLALSFLRNARDIERARALLKGSGIRIIAKIERNEALVRLDEIISAADGVMVARGDLGVETPLAELPVRQKEIIERARAHMKPVIVATEMLGSMVSHIIPTRAEVSDVANAVFDSADAVMLSAESAAGKFPVESVRMMRKVIEEAERHLSKKSWPLVSSEKLPVDVAIALSSRNIAEEIGAKVILVGTASGFSARAVSYSRPPLPIIASAKDEKISRQLAIVWGVSPVVFRGIKKISDIPGAAVKLLKVKGIVSKKDKVVFVSGVKLGDVRQTNNLSVIVVS